MTISKSMIVNTFHDIVRGLDYLHSFGIIHQDIKPSNVVISLSGRAKLCDFGCASFTENNSKSTCFQSTPLFTAPEVLTGKSGYTFESDLWSLGITLYRTIYSKYPFKGSEISLLTLRNIYEEDINIETEENDDSDKIINELIKNLLKYNPKERITLKDVKYSEWFKRENILDNEYIYLLLLENLLNYHQRKLLIINYHHIIH